MVRLAVLSRVGDGLVQLCDLRSQSVDLLRELSDAICQLPDLCLNLAQLGLGCCFFVSALLELALAPSFLLLVLALLLTKKDYHVVNHLHDLVELLGSCTLLRSNLGSQAEEKKVELWRFELAAGGEQTLNLLEL